MEKITSYYLLRFKILASTALMTNKKFEKIVTRGIRKIPERFLKKLSNVALVIEEKPTPKQKRELHIRKEWTLFGLYEGVPQLARGTGYTGVLPDKITIFKKPIEEAAVNEKDIERIVAKTVWHEIAHHFGMNEAEVEIAEEKRIKSGK